MNNRYAFGSVIIVSLFGASLLWLSTAWGNGTTPDSISYILLSRRVTGMEGIISLTSQWPPLYPVLIALADFSNNDFVMSLRMLHLLIFVLNVLLFYVLVSERFRSNRTIVIFGTLLFTFFPPLFSIHYMAWSEPAFLSFMLAFLIMFRGYLKNCSRSHLYLAAIILSLALLTRYAAVALIGSTCIFIALREDRIRSKIVQPVVFAFFCVAPLLILIIIRTLTLPGGKTPRELAFHPIEAERALSTLSTIWSWINSPVISAPIAVFVVAIVCSCIGFSISRATSRRSASIVSFMVFSSFFYIVFLFTSISLFDFHTPIDDRTLSPVLVLLLASFIVSTETLVQKFPSTQLALTGLVLVLSLTHISSVLGITSNMHRKGSGYLSKDFRSQDILRQLKVSQLPNIYTNSKETIELYLGKKANPLPATFNPATKKVSQTVDASYERIFLEIKNRQAVIVYFHWFAGRLYFPPVDFFESNESLAVLYRGTSGVIFGDQALELEKQ